MFFPVFCCCLCGANPTVVSDCVQSPSLEPSIGSADWLAYALKHLSQELANQRAVQEERDQQLDVVTETLQLLVDTIKGILSTHNRQLADVKHLLRAMAKVCHRDPNQIEQYDRIQEIQCYHIRQFLVIKFLVY